MHLKPNKDYSFVLNEPVGLTNLLVLYFDCCYFLFCSPFRFVRTKDGLFKVTKFLPHFVLSAVLNILALVNISTSLRIRYITSSLQDNASPLKYFELLSALFTNAFQVLTMKNYWFRPNRILNIINYLQSECHDITPPNLAHKTRNKILIYLLCLLFAVMASHRIAKVTLLASPESWDKTIWNRKLVSQGRFTFFLANITERSFIPDLDKLTSLDYFLAIVEGLAAIQCGILSYYPDLYLFIGVLTFWIPARCFAKILYVEMKRLPSASITNSCNIVSIISGSNKKDNITSQKLAWSKIYHLYRCMRGLCQLINEAFGSMLTVYLGSFLMFQATSIDKVLLTSSVGLKVQLVFFIVVSSSIFWLSADACNNVETLKVWMSKDENRDDIPNDQIIVIMEELESRQIGIRGSNIFTITYPLLWNTTTTIITYFIICMQSRQEEAKVKKIV